MRSPYLRWVTSEGQEQVFVFSVDQAVLGQNSDTDIILADPYVSHQHAKILKT